MSEKIKPFSNFSIPKSELEDFLEKNKKSLKEDDKEWPLPINVKSNLFEMTDNQYDYEDTFIVPQYSDIISRSEVDTSSILDPLHNNERIDVPVISANMDTVTDGNMAKAMAKAGALGALHRFMSIEENIKEYKKVGNYYPVLVSVGVNRDSKERSKALYEAGARYFIIDIAHGHHHMMKEMISWMKQELQDIFVIGGNIATMHGVRDLILWGVDGVKIGIGPGASCTTKNVTGVTVPQFSAVFRCATAAREVNRPVTIIADGGIREIGDIAKALGAGADFVMCGRMFSSCPEAPLPGVFRGMASLDSMKTIRLSDKLPTPEGKTMKVDLGVPVPELVKLIKGGLQSAFSYSNSKTLGDFKRNCRFGFRTR